MYVYIYIYLCVCLKFFLRDVPWICYAVFLWTFYGSVVVMHVFWDVL